MMDTTPSGIAAARQSGRRRLMICGLGRPAIFVALLVFTVTQGTGFVAAQDDNIEVDEIEYSVIVPLAVKSLMLDVAVRDDRLVAVGERGHVLVSTDNGGTWTQIQVPTRAMLTGVRFATDDIGIAVGHDSVILRTEDGGAAWDLVFSAPEEEAPFFDVWFADADNGIAIGAYGSFYRTMDGGITWDFEPIGDTDWHLHEITDADDGRLYMAAEAGMAYRSDDGGESWIELPSPYEGSFFGVLPLDGDTVLFFGLRGHLYRSEDAGETWTAIETGTVAMLTDGIQLSDGTIVAVGLGGTVLVSTDDGRSFSLRQQPDRRGISSLIETTDGSILLVGEFGVRTQTLAELTAAAD